MMKQTFVYRVSGEICFFFSVLNVFDAFRALRLPMALFAAACLALGLVIVRCKSAWLRFGLALLPGLSFLIGPWNLFLIAPGFAWLYYILVMTRGNYAYPLDEYRKTYTLLLTVCLFFLAANIANSTIYRGRLLSLDCLLYAFAFLLLGVMAMRRMQMGADMNRSWQLRNALTVAGFPLAAVGVSVLLFLLLRFSAPALRYLLTPLGHFVLWLLNLLFPGRAEELLAPVPTMKPEKNILAMQVPDSSHGVRGAFDADSIATGKIVNVLFEKPGVPCAQKIQCQWRNDEKDANGDYIWHNMGNPIGFGEATPICGFIVHKTAFNSSGYQTLYWRFLKEDGSTFTYTNASGREVAFTDYWTTYIGRSYLYMLGGNRGQSTNRMTMYRWTAL